jgi:hypothetical protein
MNWLPDMDLNHDKVIQSHLCYRYTIGQTEASGKLMSFAGQSRRQTADLCRPFGPRFVSRVYPRLKPWAIIGRPSGAGNFRSRIAQNNFCRPIGL